MQCLACQHQITKDMRFCPHCGATLPKVQQDPVGSVLDARFRITSRLGASAIGTLYAAEDEQLRRKVIIQILNANLLQTERRLIDRVRLVASLHHPNIAAVHDFRSGNDRAYLVLEYFEGVSLNERITDSPVEDTEVARIIVQIGAALQVAHEAGVLHGFLTPASVWVMKGHHGSSQVKLIDLGLVATPHESSYLMQAGFTPAIDYRYLSPEQLTGGESNKRSDIYGLAVIAYQLLSRSLPFDSPDKLAILNEQPTTLRYARADVAIELDAVIMRALEKDPINRQPSAGRFAEEFERAIRDRTVGLPPRPSVEVGGTIPPVEARPDATDEKPLYLDENVQFTVYRPKSAPPLVWTTMLAFAHLSERRPDAKENEPDPIEEVARQARQALGEAIEDYRRVIQDSSQAVPREGEITFVPTAPGIEFNPPSRSFRWQETVHREEFRLRASQSLDGQTARGRLSVFLGCILLADVTLNIQVDSRQVAEYSTLEPASARPYRKIFASYSHRDAFVVEQVEQLVGALGDQYLRDVTHLRAGEVWSDRLERMIKEADLFQLFWSTNSMHSTFVRREWEFALMLRRQNFIRPTYWEEPLPAAPEKNLPPDELARLHFQRISPTISAPGAGGATTVSGSDFSPFWKERTDRAAVDDSAPAEELPSFPDKAPPVGSPPPVDNQPPGSSDQLSPVNSGWRDYPAPPVSASPPPAAQPSSPSSGQDSYAWSPPDALSAQPRSAPADWSPAPSGYQPGQRRANPLFIILLAGGVILIGLMMLLGLFFFLRIL